MAGYIWYQSRERTCGYRNGVGNRGAHIVGDIGLDSFGNRFVPKRSVHYGNHTCGYIRGRHGTNIRCARHSIRWRRPVRSGGNRPTMRKRMVRITRGTWSETGVVWSKSSWAVVAGTCMSTLYSQHPSRDLTMVVGEDDGTKRQDHWEVILICKSCEVLFKVECIMSHPTSQREQFGGA